MISQFASQETGHGAHLTLRHFSGPAEYSDPASERPVTLAKGAGPPPELLAMAVLHEQGAGGRLNSRVDPNYLKDSISLLVHLSKRV